MDQGTIAAPEVESNEERSPRGQLSAHEIHLLREMFENGMTAEEIAARFA